MTEATMGRNCAHCCKTVVDFTAMSNAGIIQYLSDKNNVCGRFEPKQLNSLNHYFQLENQQPDSRWKRVIVAVGLIGQMSLSKAGAQNKPVMMQQRADTLKANNALSGKLMGTVNTASANFRTIRGSVTDEGNLPLPGATIRVPSVNTGTQTDPQGVFTLQVPSSVNRFVVSFIGYKIKEVDISGAAIASCQVKLSASQSTMGEVVVARAPFFRRMYHRLIKRPIRKIFG